MIPFETIKQALSLTEVAADYGVDSNCNHMAVCPFHPDRTPSLLVEDDHFHCFSCGAHGDVIDFTAQLLGLSIKDAAMKLAADYHLEGCVAYRPSVISRLSAPVPKRKAEQDCMTVLTQEIKQLETARTAHAPKSPEEDVHPAFVEAVQKLPYLYHCLDVLLTGSAIEREKLVRQLQSHKHSPRKEVFEYGIAQVRSHLVQRQKNRGIPVLQRIPENPSAHLQ